MSETIRTHLGLSCIVLGLALIVVGALLSPGGDLYGSVPYQVAGIAIAVVVYLVARQRIRRSS